MQTKLLQFVLGECERQDDYTPEATARMTEAWFLQELQRATFLH